MDPAADQPPLTVGFDLDMTLVDSRPGIKAVYDALAAETGVRIDSDLAITRLGPPLADELIYWFPADQVDLLADRFRALYPDLAILPSAVLSGAHDAIEAVRQHGGRSVVVTAKHAPNARLHLQHLGIDADEVVGSLWAQGKAVALRAHGASIYVGDHLSDILGARAAGAVAVAVATGPISADELRAGGADVVLDDLTQFPEWLDGFVLDARLEALAETLTELGRVVVAFSGGADSAFLLAAAVRALGPDAVAAATAVSPSLPDRELYAAREFAAGLGVEHLTPRTDELVRAGYRDNDGDRCYFCKAELIDVLAPVAAERGAVIVTGTNADDVRAGFRPGIRAALERGARTPVADVGLTKAQVRAASHRWGLPTADKPAAACLSSRIAYGLEITPARLARVDRAELALRGALEARGLTAHDLRVRDLGERAVVEIDRELVDAVTAQPDLLTCVTDEGFTKVELDPMGFRSGSMNDLLAEPERYR